MLVIDILDIYVSSVVGNDNNNGTQDYPLKTLDKAVGIINSTYIGNPLYITINLAEDGHYTQDSVLKINNSYIYYKSKQNTLVTAFNVILYNCTLMISNLNVRPIMMTMELYNSKMLVISSMVTSNYIAVQWTQSDIYFIQSTFTLNMHLVDNSKLVVNQSTIIDSILSLYSGNNQVTIRETYLNGLSINTIYDSSNDRLVFESSVLDYNISMLYNPGSYFYIDRNASFTLSNCTITSAISVKNFIEIVDSTLLIYNTTMEKSSTRISIINCLQSNITIRHFHSISVQSNYFISSEFSNIHLDNTKIEFCQFGLIGSKVTNVTVNPTDSYKIVIDQLEIYNSFGYNQMPFIELTKQRYQWNLDIKNSNISFISSIILENTNFQLSNCQIESLLKEDLFQFDLNTNVTIQETSVFASNINSGKTVFLVYNGSSVTVENSQFDSCSTFLKMSGNSMFNISHCQFEKLFSNYEIFYIQNYSQLYIFSTKFSETYSQEFMVVDLSTVGVHQVSIVNSTSHANSHLLFTNAVVVFEDLVFQTNFIGGNGFMFYNSTLDFIGNSLISEVISLESIAGDLIYIDSHSNCTFNNILFTLNFIDNLFYSMQSRIYWYNLTFIKNSADLIHMTFGYFYSQNTMVSYHTGNFLMNIMYTEYHSLNDTIQDLYNSLGHLYRIYCKNATPVTFDNLTVRRNTFSRVIYKSIDSDAASINYFSGFININNATFQENEAKNTFLQFSYNSKVLMTNSTILDNQIKNGTLLKITSSNITLVDCLISNNRGQNHTIYIDGFKSGIEFQNTNISLNYAEEGGCIFIGEWPTCTMSKTTFENNTSNTSGGCFNIASSSPFSCQLTDIGNSITNNKALNGGGGAVYYQQTSAFDPYWINADIEYSGNTALYGSDIATNISEIYIEFTNTDVFQLKFTFTLKDKNENIIILDNQKPVNFQIQQMGETLNDNHLFSLNITAFLQDGVGKVNYQLPEISSLTYSITLPDYPSIIQNVQVYTTYCSTYTYRLNNTCVYCDIGSSLNKQGNCQPCDQNLVCLNSLVYTKPNYYLANSDDINSIYQCQPNHCTGMNECTGTFNQGLLCGSCQKPNSMLFIPKTGIYCCNRNSTPLYLVFYLALLIPITIILSMKFQYSSFYSTFGKIFTFLQFISIIFFSSPYLYLLPLFRFSIDVFYDFCPFTFTGRGKALFALSTIIALVAILSIIRIIKNRKKRNDHGNLQNVYYYWSLFLILYPPVMFNLVSMIIYKTVTTDTVKKYLAIDMDINYSTSIMQWVNIGILFITIVIVLLVVGVSVLIIVKLRRPNSKSNFTKILHMLPYRKGYKWWDIIHFLKSFIFSVISIGCLYNQQLNSILLKTVQFIVGTTEYFLHPYQQPQKNHLNNFSNLLLMILILIVDFKNYLNYIGQIITIYTIISILFFILLHLYLKIKLH
ncbi:hypothetical protein DLAC_10212 [Tieghemostelium lacteum]|uniref:Transmembrane protein n=1 Tax=Tieghemostelium lacteum TaxID=361077 RepID=A0A151Z4W0_TIELA|nr:hypothetical protein DLAC_10212 [Tieghemostelium lacteum]|eukprot:KYQ88996.1 hypothetical protein DLAC_10212 [Tieghemostelium lacteum]